jgi:hypothetical protein
MRRIFWPRRVEVIGGRKNDIMKSLIFRSRGITTGSYL